MKNKSANRNLLMKKYFSKILENYPRVKLAKELGVSEHLLCQFTTGITMPSFDILMTICERFEGTTDNIIKYLNKNPELLFWYWNSLYPECLPIEKINLLVTKMINEAKQPRFLVAEGLGIPQTYLSKLEYGVITVNYFRFETVCKYFKKDILKTLNSFKDFAYIEIDRRAFGEKIQRKREELGLDIEDTSKTLNLTSVNYRKFENGERPLSIKGYVSLAKTLGITYNEAITEAFSCYYIANQGNDLEYYINEYDVC